MDFDRPADEVAPDLLGWFLTAGGLSGRIVEVEAYERRGDAASHSFRGQTDRNRSMFGPSGCLYVYRIYGMHWCANVVCGVDGHGAAVLIRALEPVDGLREMAENRGVVEANLRQLCSGPGKLCQALGITGAHDGNRLLDLSGTVSLSRPDPGPVRAVLTGPRVGISKSVDLPWRFALAESDFLSRPIT